MTASAPDDNRAARQRHALDREQFEEDAADYTAVRFATWFHDAVYDTRKDVNEEESAALAERALGELGGSPLTAALARRLNSGVIRLLERM